MKVILYLFCLFCLLFEGCFLFPDTKPITGNDTTKIPIVVPTFKPTLEWIRPSRGVVMDRLLGGEIVTAGDTSVNTVVIPVLMIYTPDGAVSYNGTIPFSREAVVKDVIVDTDGRSNASIAVVANYAVNYSPYRVSPIVSSRNNTFLANSYTQYNTRTGAGIAYVPRSGDNYVIGPSVARGPKATEKDNLFQYVYSYYSLWVVGSFTDSFQSNTYGDGQNFSCPTYGKADCYVVRTTGRVGIQWGGPENDLAYDVASDNDGNATVFLRAGSPFPITSATQMLVNVQTGYNIVRLDTNGFLTETFPVALQATGELTDTQIVLGNNGAVYILALDEVKKQFFLAKANRSGTQWIHYFPPAVSNREKTIPFGRDARMGLIVDSKDCPYVTGNFFGTVDLGGTSLSSESVQIFTAKYSPSGSCIGALAMGSGLGATLRLSPNEDALYVCGWAAGKVMGQDIPLNSVYYGVAIPGAFLVKLKL